MKTSRFNIPAFAYIEAQIIHTASNQKALEPTVRQIESKYGLKSGVLGSGIFIETRILSLLYLLIVVPKEYWSLDANHDIYKQISTSWQMDKVIIITDIASEKYSTAYSFVHHLRNAVSHANFKFELNRFEFWNINKKEIETYRAALNLDALQQFLETVGASFANHKE